jgi:hypothetical protein
MAVSMKRVSIACIIAVMASFGMVMVFVRMPTWLANPVVAVMQVDSQEKASGAEFLAAWLLFVALFAMIAGLIAGIWTALRLNLTSIQSKGKIGK